MNKIAKLKLAIDALYSTLTCTWEDNGNILADAVRDHVINVLADVSNITYSEVEEKINELVEQAQ